MVLERGSETHIEHALRSPTVYIYIYMISLVHKGLTVIIIYHYHQIIEAGAIFELWPAFEV